MQIILNQRRINNYSLNRKMVEKKEYGDYRDLPDKDYIQCEYCGVFFVNIVEHKNKCHGDKEQSKLF